ncbi:hypothetical protein Lalb_Chr16g0382661 [Lupinus albus]|uniref:Uncharacterized protein n=1 Tax=Lupinus albus TaxID=3870 RepID=A0A6A4P8U4_LUPAL|nr:hypothetical protein Lalb_Chr16g0382661 [Lupinus albus]
MLLKHYCIYIKPKDTFLFYLSFELFFYLCVTLPSDPVVACNFNLQCFISLLIFVCTLLDQTKFGTSS